MRSRNPFASCLLAALVALAVSCERPPLNFEHEITLAAAVDAGQRPTEVREHFSLEDEKIYINLVVENTVGPVASDYHVEYFDGAGNIVYVAGRAIAPTGPDWRVAPPYLVNPEIDVPGLWFADIYLDRRFVDRVHFPVTATADEVPLEIDPPPFRCCPLPGEMTAQVFFSSDVNEANRLVGRRDHFTFADDKMYVYLRLNNIASGDHVLRYEFFDGQNVKQFEHEQPFTVQFRDWIAWAWKNIEAGKDAAGLWTVIIHFDDTLLGSFEVLVED
jgi:hypothetical protein